MQCLDGLFWLLCEVETLRLGEGQQEGTFRRRHPTWIVVEA